MRILRDSKSVSEDYSNRIFLAERNNGINKLPDQSKSILNPVLNLDSLTNASKLQLCDRYYFTATCNYDIRLIVRYTQKIRRTSICTRLESPSAGVFNELRNSGCMHAINVQGYAQPNRFPPMPRTRICRTQRGHARARGDATTYVT